MEAKEKIRFCDSYTRLGAIIELLDEMAYRSWLKLLGEYWTTFDNISSYQLELYYLLDGPFPIRQMMNRAEFRKYEALPEVLAIYRGCHPANQLGMSWSLDRQTAEGFPFLNRYSVEQPLLVTARVRKDEIIAFKDGRGESEIITIDADIVSVNPITEERGTAFMEAHSRGVREAMRLLLSTAASV